MFITECVEGDLHIAQMIVTDDTELLSGEHRVAVEGEQNLPFGGVWCLQVQAPSLRRRSGI